MTALEIKNEIAERERKIGRLNELIALANAKKKEDYKALVTQIMEDEDGAFQPEFYLYYAFYFMIYKNSLGVSAKVCKDKLVTLKREIDALKKAKEENPCLSAEN